MTRNHLRIANATSPEDIRDGQWLDDERSFDYGGGSGGGSDMSERLERLEKKVSSIEGTLTQINESLIRLDAKFELQTSRLSGAMELQSQKLSSALELQSSNLSSALDLQSQRLSDEIQKQSLNFDGKLKEQKIAIVMWVLTIPSAVFGIIKLYELLAAK